LRSVAQQCILLTYGGEEARKEKGRGCLEKQKEEKRDQTKRPRIILKRNSKLEIKSNGKGPSNGTNGLNEEVNHRKDGRSFFMSVKREKLHYKS